MSILYRFRLENITTTRSSTTRHVSRQIIIDFGKDVLCKPNRMEANDVIYHFNDFQTC